MHSKPDRERIDRYAGMPLDQLRKTAHGLKKSEIESQRAKYGSNRIEKIKKDTVAFRLRRAFINPFSVVLLVLALISFFVDILFAFETNRNYTTVVIISVMLLFSRVIRLVEEFKLGKVILKVQEMSNRSEYYRNLIAQYEKSDDIPVDYSRKIATVLLKDQQNEFVMMTQGSVDAVLEHCSYASYKGKTDSDG